MKTEKTPASTSSDYEAMSQYWDMIAAIMGGSSAMREAGQAYLPKFPNESKEDYQDRLKKAKFTNIFGDIVETLSSKPFENEIEIESASSTIEDLLENIDGQGNHIHVFASNLFNAGVADAITWFMVDYTKGVPAGATLAQERALGARPYWVHIPARNLVAVYSKSIGGRDEIVHARILENSVEREGWGEVTHERVRVLDRAVTYNDQGEALSAAQPTWELFEKQEDKGENKWVLIGGGEMTIDRIPLVPFITGKRKGASWVVRPPLEAAAHLQIKHYQYESGLDYAADNTCFPMLAGNGVTPDMGEDGNVKPVPVGPKGVLYAPPGVDGEHGEWKFIEPGAQSLTFVSDHMVKATEMQIRELGRQPLTAQSGNITTITAAFAGDKAHTVIEAWALNFKDALENGLKLTAEWLKLAEEPEVQINTDFSLALKEDAGTDAIEKARERGDISQETYWLEMKRRGHLSPNFDSDKERQRLINEMPGDGNEEEEEALSVG